MSGLTRLHRVGLAVIAATTAALLAGIVGVATGAIPGQNGRIDACYTRVGGVLRVIDAQAGQACTRLETGLHWNVQGQAGPRGEPGPQGPPGTASIAVRFASASAPGSSGGQVIVQCLPGEVATGGGFEHNGHAELVNLNASHPAGPLQQPDGWFVRVWNSHSVSTTVTAFALCAQT